MNRRPERKEDRGPAFGGPVRLEANIAAILGLALTLLVMLSNGGIADDTSAQIFVPVVASSLGAVAGILGLIILSGVFAAAETAVGALRPMHVKHVKSLSAKQSRRLQRLLDSQARYHAACVLGGHATRIAAYLVGLIPAFGLVGRLAQWFGEEPGQGFGYGLFVGATFLVWIPIFLLNLVLGDLVPKSYASLHPIRVSGYLFRFIQGFGFLFTAPAAVVNGITGVLAQRFGEKSSMVLSNQAEEEIKQLVENAEETGAIEGEEKNLLHSVFEFTDTIAREVMTPRVDMDAMPVTATPQELATLIESSGHSRIPLYEGTDDQIIGIIHAKDLLRTTLSKNGHVNLKDLMHPALFVPEGKNLHELLAEMKASKTQMAIVQDEFGGTAGIVTIEDIVEELVGEIQDEYDVEEPEIVPMSDGFSIDGRTHVDDVAEVLGIEIEAGEFDTVGGYVFGLFGRQPRLQESVEAVGHRFTVSESDGRRILRLQVEKLPEAEVEDASLAD